MHSIRNIQSPYSTDEAFWDHYEGEERTLALFLKLTPAPVWTNLPALGFTSFSEDVYLPAHSLTFKSSAGLNPSTAESEEGKPSNVEMSSVFDESLTEEDLLAGKWNNATFELWIMNWNDLKMGEFVVQTGIITEVKDKQQTFVAEVAGVSSAMETNFGDLTSRTCRAIQPQNGGFGGFRCKKDLDDETSDGFQIKNTLTVSSVVSRTEIHFTRDENVPDTFYTNGTIKGLEGLNEDLRREIRVATGVGTGTVNVFLKRAFPFEIVAGQEFELIAGCDGTLERCHYFENVINADAEFFIPTAEQATSKIT